MHMECFLGHVFVCIGGGKKGKKRRMKEGRISRHRIVDLYTSFTFPYLIFCCGILFISCVVNYCIQYINIYIYSLKNNIMYVHKSTIWLKNQQEFELKYLHTSFQIHPFSPQQKELLLCGLYQQFPFFSLQTWANLLIYAIYHTVLPVFEI